MPTYCFVCDECGKKAEEFRPMAECGKAMKCRCGEKMRRDYVAESPGRHLPEVEIVCVSMGVDRSQIAEETKALRERGLTDFEFRSDGAMVFKGDAHAARRARDKAAAVIGESIEGRPWRDKDGFN